MPKRSIDLVELTDEIVANAVYRGTNRPGCVHYLRDLLVPNFACRLTPGGTKTFTYFYRTHEGKQKVATLGRFNDAVDPLTTAQAREKAKEIRRGLNPSKQATDQTTLLAPAPWGGQAQRAGVVLDGGHFFNVLNRFSVYLAEEKAIDEAEAHAMRMRGSLLQDIIGILKDAFDLNQDPKGFNKRRKVQRKEASKRNRVLLNYSKGGIPFREKEGDWAGRVVWVFPQGQPPEHAKAELINRLGTDCLDVTPEELERDS